MRQTGALVDQAEAARTLRRRGRPRFSAWMRNSVIMGAIMGVAAGVWWLKNETPNPAPAYADRQSPLVEARSLKPLLQTAAPSEQTAYTANPPPLRGWRRHKTWEICRR